MPAVRVPSNVGANTAEIVQLAPGERLPLQVPALVKSAELVPPRTILLMLNAAVPELLKVTL